jgi:hypothetical protein
MVLREGKKEKRKKPQPFYRHQKGKGKISPRENSNQIF